MGGVSCIQVFYGDFFNFEKAPYGVCMLMNVLYLHVSYASLGY